MEFYRIWRILAGNKWVLIWLPLIATIAGLGTTYVLPEQYESTALVVVRPFEDVKFSTGGPDSKEMMGFPVSQAVPIDAPSKTYMEEIKSTAVAEKIVEALHLDVKRPVIYTSQFDEIKDKVKAWVSDAMRSGRNYFKYGRDIPTTPFERAMEDIADKLAVAVRKDTYAFDITYHSSDPRQAADVANMAAQIFLEHSSDAHRTEAARAREFIETQLEESRKALEQARADILAYKNSADTFALTSEYNEKLKNVSELESTLAKDEAKLAGLSRSYHDGSSPLIIAQVAEINELKGQIAAWRNQLAGYPKKELRMNSYSLAEKTADDNYEFLLKRYLEARVKEAASVNEIRIVSAAVPSLYPTKPLKYMYAGIGFAVALVVAIGWALFFEYLDPRVRTIRDVDDFLGIPVLGAIPRLKRVTGGG